MTLGGGRETKESSIDLSVGIILKKKNGDFVKEGETIAVVYAMTPEKMERAMERSRMRTKLQLKNQREDRLY